MLKKVLIGAGVVLVLGVVVVASLKGSRKTGARVYVEAAAPRDVVRLVKARGEIDPRLKVNLSAHVIGKIERLYVEEGDEIEQGRPFLELEKEAFLAVRDQASAQLAIAESRQRQAEISLADAQLKLKRMQRLSRELIASTEQLEAAELGEASALLALEQAKEAVTQARAALDKAEDDLEKCTIFAPLTGRVIALNAEEGEVVVSGTMNNPGSVIGTIADLSEILAEVDVDETEVAFLELAQTATLKVDALPDHEYAGRVVEIGSSGFETPQQPDVTFFKVKLLLDQPDAALRPGMSVRAEIETAREPGVLAVPIQAVVNRPPVVTEGEDEEENGEIEKAGDEVKVVFVVGDDKVQQREVETGLSDPTHVEIVSGLEEGEEVVTGPYRSLKDLEDGDDVRVQTGSEEDEDEESG